MAGMRARREARQAASLGGTGGGTIAGGVLGGAGANSPNSPASTDSPGTLGGGLMGTIGRNTVLRMPDSGSPAFIETSRIRMERQRREGGRLSTILSNTLRRRLRGAVDQ